MLSEHSSSLASTDMVHWGNDAFYSSLSLNHSGIMLRTITATRYVTPLREGGSLPAIVEADDDGLYVIKFCGAGQGTKALIAELIAGEIGRVLNLPVPEIVFIDLDPVLGRSEPDFEIQALLKKSAGLNIALDFLPGALAFDALDRTRLEPLLASSITWFDAYITNVDRTPRNTNMLWWHRRLMLIDHGAALYAHHIAHDFRDRSATPFSSIKDHVLLPVASALHEADRLLKTYLTPAIIRTIVEHVPTNWLLSPDGQTSSDASDDNTEATRAALEEERMIYIDYLLKRLDQSSVFVEEAIRARKQLV